MESKKEPPLWNLFLSGDDEAYSSIYKMYAQDMYAYALHFTTDEELVKDCIQDVFVKIYQNRSGLSTIENGKLYLFVALKNRLMNNFRKKVNFCSIEDVEPAFCVDYTIEDEIIENEQKQYLADKMIRMLHTLSPRQKEAMYYRFIEELSYEEIGKLMQINYQSIQNLIQRSIKKLQETFAGEPFYLFALLLLIRMSHSIYHFFISGFK
ncbi:RNA polymerase sigma factor [Parabacteroides pacaensis]|uniref:RNA polymerase sigma factor n=1 Tax=Parabacteroides pacaensis TaxID=2086575 RepID=UPI000D0FE171|nr:sigma-70 family RNA polymerase sigma factor [Parabacteroides pacaensis]